MKKFLILSGLIIFTFLFQACGLYSFTGADTGEAESFQVNFFQNNADLVEPGIDRAFTISLQDLILNQTSLNLTNTNGDLIFENTAAQNRLTISVNVRYYNTLEPEKDFERRFSFYFDYPAQTQLVGANLETALDEIYTRLTQDIFNAALTDW